MRDLNENNITDAVLSSIAKTDDPRVKEVLSAVVRHLHDLAREVRPTHREWGAVIDFLFHAGKISTPERNEFILASDILGVSPLVDIINGPPSGGTEVSVLGPFYGGPGALPADVAVLLIHAINPHGFAWLRRVTEEGADLNRNWIDFNRPLPENPGYDALADAILPGALDGPGLASAQSKLAAWRDKHGEHAFRAILDDGQFKHPFGPYYGGAAPTWARRTLETIIEENRLALRDLVAVIDFHTGRGPYGSGEPICGHRPDTAGRRLTRQWYGDSLTAPCADRTADPRVGLSQYGWLYELGDRVAFISLEFGTYDFETTFKALQADHWLHARGDVTWDCPKTRDIKMPLQRAYYPDRTDCRELVLFRSRQAIGQALAGLADEAGY